MIGEVRPQSSSSWNSGASSIGIAPAPVGFEAIRCRNASSHPSSSHSTDSGRPSSGSMGGSVGPSERVAGEGPALQTFLGAASQGRTSVEDLFLWRVFRVAVSVSPNGEACWVAREGGPWAWTE
jgi:hypothetical protein